MYSLAIVHLDEQQAKIQENAWVETINKAIQEKVRIYNFQHWRETPSILQRYNKQVITIPYREGEVGKNIEYQFLDGKLNMADYSVNEVRIGGQHVQHCVQILVDLLNGNSQDLWPSAEDLGWSAQKRDYVLKRKFKSVLIENLLIL